MNPKDTPNSTKEQTRSNNEMFKGLKCDFFIKNIFVLLADKKLLELIKCNKKLQKIMDVNINNYKIYHEIYTSIELEMTLKKERYGEFINIKDEDKKYYHIYFNNNKKEEIKRYELNNDDNVSKINIIIDYQIISFNKLFYLCQSIESINFKKFYRININNTSFMFRGCSSLKELNLSNFKTNNVTDMSFMFYRCSSLISLPDISKWNINNVKYMIDIFKGCNSLVSLPDFSKWNINRAKECYEFIDMEQETNEFQYKDKFKKFKFNNIDSMNMYDECLSLLSLPNFKKSSE